LAVSQGMGLKQIIAKNIKSLRLESGLTQKELSELAHINRSYIGMIEREEVSPTVDMLDKIATAFDVDPIDLLSTNSRKAQ
jgi:transcriptional regulator with XRE-family HTH domain